MAHNETNSQAHDEQPGLELAPHSGPEVVYGQGLEFDHNKPPVTTPYDQAIRGSPPVAHIYGQHYGAPPYDPYHQSAYLASASGGPPSPYKTPQQERIWGLPKKKFWILLGALIIAVLVIALALGLGLGLGLSSHQGTSSSSSASYTPTATPRPSATSSANSTLSCPSSNGTTYTSASQESFKIYCAIDYNSLTGSGTVDLSHMRADTVESCIYDCASDSDCVGAGWGWYQPDSSLAGSDVCWLKSQLGTPQLAVSDWFFIIKE
ncbi:hypothetical protein VP1G_03810 [Cytospora mali]|uniref:Apple domain-containing protein n=1 Tax=Cytospora mali TaxID=578113 RepID=A0A194UXU3_CYTMA|nr:hypothetical protein VP1G_03810 [Valsa mali var. pyri (nom. inval.)]